MIWAIAHLNEDANPNLRLCTNKQKNYYARLNTCFRISLHLDSEHNSKCSAAAATKCKEQIRVDTCVRNYSHTARSHGVIFNLAQILVDIQQQHMTVSTTWSTPRP